MAVMIAMPMMIDTMAETISFDLVCLILDREHDQRALGSELIVAPMNPA